MVDAAAPKRLRCALARRGSMVAVVAAPDEAATATAMALAEHLLVEAERDTTRRERRRARPARRPCSPTTPAGSSSSPSPTRSCAPPRRRGRCSSSGTSSPPDCPPRSPASTGPPCVSPDSAPRSPPVQSPPSPAGGSAPRPAASSSPPTTLRSAAMSPRRHGEGFDVNVNLLGEAIVGDDEADARLDALCARMRRPDVAYVSVKISALCANLDVLAFDHEVERIAERLRTVYDVAAEQLATGVRQPRHGGVPRSPAHGGGVLPGPRRAARTPSSPPGSCCRRTCPTPTTCSSGSSSGSPAGAAAAAPRSRCAWSKAPTWPWSTSTPSSAAGRRLRTARRPTSTPATRPCSTAASTPPPTAGCSSASAATTSSTSAGHSPSDAIGRSSTRSASRCSRAWRRRRPGRPSRDAGGVVLYTPVVTEDDFAASIAYLSRRLDENAGPENFLRSLFTITPGSAVWDAEQQRFEAAVAGRTSVSTVATPGPGPTHRGPPLRSRRPVRQRAATPTSPTPATGHGSPSTSRRNTRPSSRRS